MGLTVSTSFGKLRDNSLLLRFVGKEHISENDEFWDSLLTFSFSPPKQTSFAVFNEAVLPLLEQLASNNLTSKNLTSLVKVCLNKATPFKDESKCESNLSTLYLRNGLFILRCCTQHIIQVSGDKALLAQFGETPPPSAQSSSSNPEGTLGLLLQGIVTLLNEIPLVPFTYDIHTEAINMLLVLMSGQIYTGDPLSSDLTTMVMNIPKQMVNALVHTLLNHFVSQPPPPPEYLRSQPAGLVSSVTSGLLSLVLPNRSIIDPSSSLALSSLLFLLIMIHQNSKGTNSFREALNKFCDDHEQKDTASFQFSLDKLYQAICKELQDEQSTLFLYQLLHGNQSFSSYVFSRTDIDLLVIPLLRQLNEEGKQPSHHSYMLLIILLILSQDECFNKSVHEKTVKAITWSGDKIIPKTSLGSLMVIVLVRTVHRNIQHLRDKFLHTNCLATLANMSSQFNNLSLEASEKIVNLFKVLGKRYLRCKGEVSASTAESTTSLSDLTTDVSDPTSPKPDSADTQTLEEILQMLLEIINSGLTHTLHNNPHLVYSLLYQREVFAPFHSRPGFIDLVQNIEMVISYFSECVEKKGTAPYSANFVLETIQQSSLSWPKNRLRSFSELKFRYVEESQPEEFFIPYVWTLIHKRSDLYLDPSKIKFSSTQSQ